MSLFRSHRPNAEQEQPILKYKDGSDPHRHEQQNTAEESFSNMAESGREASADASAGQKMISATWGSILTSVLGMFAPLPRPRH